MKKIIITSALAMLSLSGAAHATGINNLIGSGNVTTVQCTWLSSDVKVSLSNKVVAAFDCETAATNQTMFIGTTSALGTTKTRTMSCAVSSAGADATTAPTCNDPTCTATASSTGGTCTGSFTVTGNTLFSASSSGGTVSSGQLGGSCSPDDLATCGTDVQAAVTALATVQEAADAAAAQ